jgi:hypothetical protein
MKQYSPPRLITNVGSSVRRRRMGRWGSGELAGAIVGARERVLFIGSAEEHAVVEPLRLYELELAVQARHGGDEDDPAVGAVVLQHPGGSIGP